MTIIEIGLAAASAALLIPTTVLFLQVAAATRRRKDDPAPGVARPSVAILVPAHDEASGIRECLAELLPQLAPGDRLLVVADNCSDDTASIAASMGAEVVARRDAAKRGKGYALDYGVRHLAARPPEVLIMVDADCRTAPGTIDRLARVCHERTRPVQALYLMQSANGGSRCREFAWLVKNLVRPLGYHRLGLPCQLMGSGMAFPWSQIASAPLANGDLVEDLALGLHLARNGTAPVFCPEALVTSRFPQSAQAVVAQRTRWEHGHLGLIAGLAPRLLMDAVVKRDGKLLALALDLCVPPVALLTLLVSGLFVVNALAGAFIALGVSTAAGVLLFTAIVGAWSRYGRHLLSPADLALAPLHALSKTSFYVRFLARRETAWVRAVRDDALEEEKHA
jgi:cellulose synthase/poly-beta-1,6-N-acetylglucosamine synthase-like glycosyltransferase